MCGSFLVEVKPSPSGEFEIPTILGFTTEGISSLIAR